jgi:hypothetical protein
LKLIARLFPEIVTPAAIESDGVAVSTAAARAMMSIFVFMMFGSFGCGWLVSDFIVCMFYQHVLA